MIDNFSSQLGIERFHDESLVDYLFPDDIVDLFYQSDAFVEGLLDFGGGITGITCRSVLLACRNEDDEPDAKILAKQLGLAKRSASQQTLVMCENIIRECKRQLDNSAYLL